MASVYKPGVEAEASDTGEIHIDGAALKALPDLSEDSSYDQTSVVKNAVLDFGDECFLLKNVLTTKECDQFMKNGEDVGFEAIGYARDDYRSSQRISFQSSHLADLLWQRIKGFLKPIVINGDPLLQHIEGISFMMQGTWVPKELNNIFRLCKYKQGGHFAPHNDGYFVRSSTVRSLQTCMLYLNGNFTKGSTNFIDPNQELHKDAEGKYCAEEKNILVRIQPEEGLAIIFNHNRLHEGEKLGDGEKYILRTDIMYENISPSPSLKSQDEALKLLQEADRLESCGQCIEAMNLYRRAYKLCPELENSR